MTDKEFKSKCKKNKKSKVKIKQLNYKSYLKSNKWKKLRETKLKLAGYKCEKCGSTDNLHLHHKTYKRLYKEHLKDLIVLCEICHKEEHGLLTEEEIEHRINLMMQE